MYDTDVIFRSLVPFQNYLLTHCNSSCGKSIRSNARYIYKHSYTEKRRKEKMKCKTPLIRLRKQWLGGGIKQSWDNDRSSCNN